MKKIILFITFVAVTMPLFSQFVRPGIKGGINLANEKIKNGNQSYKFTSIISFHAGFLLDIALSDNLYIQPQLLLSGKGSKDDEIVYRPYYIELPINILYKYEINEDLKIYGGLGPGIGLGIFGSRKNLNTNTKRKLIFGETTNSDYKTADITGGIEFGAELNSKLGLGIGYRWSFADVTIGSSKVTSKIINFSLAYFFGEAASKKKKSTKK